MPQLPDAPVDLVVVTLGVNDVLRMTSTRAWQRAVTALVVALGERLRPGGGIVLAGVPDLTGFPVLPQPTRAVLALHGRALDLGLAVVAAGSPSARYVGAPRIDTDGLSAADGFHPGVEGYRRWAEHLVEAVPAAERG